MPNEDKMRDAAVGCGRKYDNSNWECVVTTQLEKESTWLGAFPPPSGCCSNVMSALTLASNVHGCTVEADTGK